MTQIATQDDINQVINKMIEVGITPPNIENREAFVRFNTEGCLNNSGYYYLTEGIRKDKSSYFMASFGCFDRGIDEFVCTLHERPEGVDEVFFFSSKDKHRHNVEKQRAIYLDEISNASHKNKVGKQSSLESQALEDMDKKHEEKDGFVFYKGFDKARKFLSDSEQLSYLNSIIDYGLYGKTINASLMVQGMLELIKPNLDANYKNWKNSKKGGRPRKVKN